MKDGVTVKDNSAAMQKALKELSQLRIMVGVPKEGGDRREGGINNAALAYIHDNGAPEANIPPRPFMGPGIKAAQQQIEKYLKAGGQAAFDGNVARAMQNMNAAGLAAVNAIRAVISAGIPPPLKRPRKGRSIPLIDTGQLRNAITYVIRKEDRGKR